MNKKSYKYIVFDYTDNHKHYITTIHPIGHVGDKTHMNIRISNYKTEKHPIKILKEFYK